jgi:hypothetical protein
VEEATGRKQVAGRRGVVDRWMQRRALQEAPRDMEGGGREVDGRGGRLELRQ